MNADVEQVDAIFGSLVASGHVPGISYGVVEDGALVHHGGAGVGHVYGGDTPDQHSVFRIASLTKSFTASAVLRLRDAGALHLDDAVATYVPEVAAAGLPTTDSPALTIRHLLSMSAGLPTDDAWADRQESMTPDELAAFLHRGVGFVSAPGTAFEYSNLGFAMLGRVVTAVAGRDYRDEVRAAILEPIGLRQTVFSDSDVDPTRLTRGHRRTGRGWEPLPFDRPGVFSAIGGLYSSVADLALWISGLAAAFPARDEPDDHPVRRATRREMQQQHRSISTQPLLAVAGGHAWPAPTGYGFGLFVEDDATGPVISHPGGYPGYGAHMRWSPTHGIGVVVLANATYAPVHQPAAQALAALLGRRARPRTTPWPATVKAVADVHRLLASWDDRLADEVFAANVDLDKPRAERRAELEAARAAIGYGGSGLVSELGAVAHPTPAGATWTVRGERGRLLVEIRLTPQVPPRVQTMSVTVCASSDVLDAAARDLLAAFTSDSPRWPAHLTHAVDVDPAALLRASAAAVAVDGPFQALGDVVAGEQPGSEQPGSATYELTTATALWHLALSVDPATGDVTRCALTPAGLQP